MLKIVVIIHPVFEGSKCSFPRSEKEYNMLFLLRVHTLNHLTFARYLNQRVFC